MKSRLKKITIFSLVFLFIFSTTLTTAPKKEVKAAEGYSGKISRHWTRLRTGKSKKAKVLKTLKVGTAVTVYGTSGSWRKVSVAGKTGYVPKQYVYVGTKAPSLTGSTYEKGQTVAEFAQRFVGNPYVWGGESLTNGVDCSGFTMQVYKHFGYSLPHSSTAQRYEGTAVSWNEKQPGDLICYQVVNGVGHVAIYIGDNQIIHAGSKDTGINVRNADYRAVWGVRRIVQ